MSDKPIAGLLTAIAVAPLCLVCALGPAGFAAAAGLFLAWLGGFSLPLIAAVVAAAGWVGWRASHRIGAAAGPGHGAERTAAVMPCSRT